MESQELSKSHKLGAKVIFIALSVLKENGSELSGKEVREKTEEKLAQKGELDSYATETYAKSGLVRWKATLQFFSISAQRARYLEKKKGIWRLMPEGEKALAEHKGKAEDFFRKIRTEFLEWQREKFKKEAIITTHPNQNIDESDEKEIEEKGASFFRKDNLEEDSQQTIIDYIEKKDPWEMQELVAALLKSMGYYISYIAPRGHGDGGIDILAYNDPLGTPPRIKVQVKHKIKTKTPPREIRELNGILKTGEIGVFISSGGFTTDAKNTAKQDNPIELIDLDRFIELWTEFYKKLKDEDKDLLPIKNLYYIDAESDN